MPVLSRYTSIAVLLCVAACAPPPSAATPESASARDMAELWIDPATHGSRNLYDGPGGAALRPAADAEYQFAARKTTGTNPGYDVRDAAGRLWSVKLGIEAQSEVTASRILWAMGFHQPPTYYLPQFTLSGEDAGVKKEARFRGEIDGWTANDYWSWYANPFADTPAFRGLIVSQLILTAWDLKTPNNRIYESSDPSHRPRRWFMVRDVGATLGEAKQLLPVYWLGTAGYQGTKNDIDDFERQGFIVGVNGDRVEFDYRGRHDVLVNLVKVADVIWACELLARLSDEQWRDAFRAGGYEPDIAARFISKIKRKISQGLALRSATTMH